MSEQAALRPPASPDLEVVRTRAALAEGALEARDLWFRYGARRPWIVAGIDLCVAAGEVVGLRGPSGRGKTTVARLLSGHLRPQRGQVTAGGRALPAGAQPVQLVAQHPELAVDPRWRLREVLTEAGPLDRALLAALSIPVQWLDRFPHELSGGELQRAAVARALASGAPFVVADEASAMLDPLTQAQIWHVLLDRVRADGLGVLAVSHDDALLDRVADRVVDLPAPR